MRFARPGDPELWAAITRYVGRWPDTRVPPPRYEELLHGSLLNLDGSERSAFAHDMGHDARHVTDDELSTLLDSDWRPRLTAAWLIGLDRRTQFRDRIGAQLLDSGVMFAGQGYCLALARFEGNADADILCAYLDKYLPQLDRHYDQHWAIGALLHLDERLGSNRANRFLTPGGLWDKSATSRHDPAEWHRHITRLCTFADECVGDPGPQHDTPGNPA
jgi:hypothetical protein